MDKRLLLSSLSLIFAISLVGEVYAGVHEGHAEATWVYPFHYLDVAVDTVADTINIKWQGADAILLPVPALRCPLTPWWKAYDDKGYYEESGFGLPHSSSATLEGYTDTETWLTVEVLWTYSNGAVWITVFLKVNIYMPANPPNPISGQVGGTGGGCGFPHNGNGCFYC